MTALWNAESEHTQFVLQWSRSLVEVLIGLMIILSSDLGDQDQSPWELWNLLGCIGTKSSKLGDNLSSVASPVFDHLESSLAPVFHKLPNSCRKSTANPLEELRIHNRNPHSSGKPSIRQCINSCRSFFPLFYLQLCNPNFSDLIISSWYGTQRWQRRWWSSGPSPGLLWLFKALGEKGEGFGKRTQTGGGWPTLGPTACYFSRRGGCPDWGAVAELPGVCNSVGSLLFNKITFTRRRCCGSWWCKAKPPAMVEAHLVARPTPWVASSRTPLLRLWASARTG